MSQDLNLRIEYDYNSDDDYQHKCAIYEEYQHKCAIYEEYQQYISNKALKYICNLPCELKKIIFYFIPLNSIRTNEAKLIGNIISVYNIDHNYDYTKMAKMYYEKKCT